MADRIKPLVDVSPVWERELSTYPDLIKVTMSDGHVVTYRQDVTQPAPAFTAVMEVLDKMPVYGGYKARHEEQKKPNLWDRIQKVRQKK